MRTRIFLYFLLTAMLFIFSSGCSGTGAPTDPDNVGETSFVLDEEYYDAGPQDYELDDPIRDAQGWSPGGFPTGQCTWYCDGKWKKVFGYPLKFSVSSGRHAYRWYDLVTNTNKVSHINGLQAMNIVVFNKSSSLPYGHVAWVYTVIGNKVVLLHANWSSGTYLGKISGVPVRATTFTRVGSNSLKSASGKIYSIKGVLYYKYTTL